jgi:cell division protein FtsB
VKLTLRRALLVVGPLLVALVGWGWWQGTVRVRETRRELAQLQRRLETLAAERARLAREVESLKQEREARARAAREALDVAAPGEVLVVLPPETPSPGARGQGSGKRN